MKLLSRAVAEETKPNRLNVRSLLELYGVVILGICLAVVLSLMTDSFFTAANINNLIQQWAFIGIMACAATVLMIAGCFDLSVAAVFALSGVVAASVAASHGVLAGICAALLTGVVVGAINGGIVGYLGINSFLATLASGFILRGVALTISGGLLVTVSDPGFSKLGRGEFLGFSLLNWAFVAAIAIIGFILHSTVYGRAVYASGSNEEGAYLAGVNVRQTKFIAYVISGIAASVAGFLAASQSSTGQAASGTGYELLVVAAVVLGGTSITGGRGAIWRTVVGTLVLGLIANGSNLLGLSGTLQQIIQGAIILLAVVLDRFSRSASH